MFKMAFEETDLDDIHINKKTKEDSKDLFSSQDIHFQNTESNPKLSLRSSKSLTSRKNTSPENKSRTKENKPGLHAPSLDMFAPSGERSSRTANISVLNQTEARPSCEDMFGSSSSKVLNSKTVEKNDAYASTSHLQVNKSKIMFEDNDEFSFPVRKRTSRPSLVNDENDEFSFSVNKRRRVQEQPTNEDDVFSFTSNKNSSTKRTRQSNPDMFSSGGTSSSSVAGSSKLSSMRNNKERDEIDFRRSRQIPDDDSLTFPEDSLPKRKRYKESLNFANDSKSEVKIALFSKTITDTKSISDQQNEVRPEIKMDVAEDGKNLVTYSKNMPNPTKLKKEIKDEEVDELAIELHNATIVLVKPLLVSRPKPVDLPGVSIAGKNFKKFRKVIGVKKPVIPQIIGGSDLVAHHKEKDELPDNLRPLPPLKQTPDDDWTFLGDKRKGRGR